MKKPNIIILLFFIVFASYGQHITMSPMVERTVINTKLGFAGGWAYESGWEVGGFYQEETEKPQVYEALLPKYYERVFYGAYVQHPVYKYDCNVLSLNVRSGLVNDKKILIAPSLRYDIMMSKRISFDVGLGGAAFGTKTFRATMYAGIKFHS